MKNFIDIRTYCPYGKHVGHRSGFCDASAACPIRHAGPISFSPRGFGVDVDDHSPNLLFYQGLQNSDTSCIYCRDFPGKKYFSSSANWVTVRYSLYRKNKKLGSSLLFSCFQNKWAASLEFSKGDISSELGFLFFFRCISNVSALNWPSLASKWVLAVFHVFDLIPAVLVSGVPDASCPFPAPGQEAAISQGFLIPLNGKRHWDTIILKEETFEN